MTRTSEFDLHLLARCRVVFDPADPPRAGLISFHLDEDDATGPDPGPGAVVARLPADAAVGPLTRARRIPHAHPTVGYWGEAAMLGLRLVARGRLLPGVSPAGFDAWRAGPFDPTDAVAVQRLAGRRPAGPGPPPGPTPGAEAELRAFLDAVADGMPRTGAASTAIDAPVFAGRGSQRVPELRSWADRVASLAVGGAGGLPTPGPGAEEVRVSLRVEASGPEVDTASFRIVVQVHSIADPTVVADAGRLWDGTAPAALGDGARLGTIAAIRRAADAWPPLEHLLSAAIPDGMAMTDAEVNELLGPAAGRLRAARVEVRWPRDWLRGLTSRAQIGATRGGRGPGTSDDGAPGGGAAGGLFAADQLVGFSWRIALGHDPLTEAEMDRLAEASRPVVRLRDRWVLVEPDLARRARERDLTPLRPMAALGAALTGRAELGGATVAVTATGWWEELRARLGGQGAGGRALLQAPPGLRATLRDYQLRGLRWLAEMTSLGLGGCLADDMGLGKTIMMIALHLHRQADPSTAGATLVVCPASLLGNWEREIHRFAPGTAVARFHGTGRSLPAAADAADAADAAAGFVLTTYPTMRLDTQRADGGLLRAAGFSLVVADEAQHVKNHRSGTARALRTIPAAARVALTGTPVENSLTDLWAILDWTTPGLLGPLTTFRERWAGPIEASGGVAGLGDEDPATTPEPIAAAFTRLVGPFLLRRRKSDPGIAPELPAKTETDRPVSLTHEQAALYEAVSRETLEQIQISTGMERRGLVFRLLTSLKQICNHPAHYLREPEPVLAGRSGKLDLLDELVDTILAEGGAVLVFSQYVAMARLLEQHLDARGVPTQFLHGGTPVPRRDEMVARFQASPPGSAPVFLLSLKAAGTGLNLTRADHVIHYDRWWNPAVEDQATDRAHRIGQTRPVQVHRLIAEGTLEDRIDAMLREKKSLADAVLSGGEAAMSELSDAGLAELVTLAGGPWAGGQEPVGASARGGQQ